MDCTTPDKPEVLALTVKMGWDDPDLTVGKLFRLWRWFDQHTTDGNAVGVTSALLDRQVGVTGFIDAVASVGWLEVTDNGIRLSKFEKHNGSSAKSRAQTAKRVASHKTNAKTNADTVTGALPREEKRREEKIDTEANASVGAKRATRKCPDSFVITDELRAWAAQETPGVSVDLETATFRDHTFQSSRSDWPGTWRNWMRKAAQHTTRSTPARQFADKRAEQAQAFAPGVAARKPFIEETPYVTAISSH